MGKIKGQLTLKKKIVYYCVSVFVTICLTIVPLFLWIVSGAEYTGVTSIRGTSMSPTIENNDILFYQPVKFERGEIVVAFCPTNSKYSSSSGAALLKRIVGMPEETITITENGVLINGQLLSENYTNNQNKTLSDDNDISEIVLSYDEYFLLGDNRETSFDSRHVGAFHRSSFLYGLTTEPNDYTKELWIKAIVIAICNIGGCVVFWIVFKKFLMIGQKRSATGNQVLDANWQYTGPVITSRHFKKKKR